jgi:hypothetical protein
MGGKSSKISVCEVEPLAAVPSQATTADGPPPPVPGVIGTVSMSAGHGPKHDVPVTVDDLHMTGAKAVLETPMFLEWIEECEKDDKLFISRVSIPTPAAAAAVHDLSDCACTVVQIHIQSVDMFGPRVGFVKLRSESQVLVASQDADGSHPTVIDVPGIVFMRGGSVGVLIILACEGEEYTILTYQARVPAADHNLPEIPAGMLVSERCRWISLQNCLFTPELQWQSRGN